MQLGNWKKEDFRTRVWQGALLTERKMETVLFLAEGCRTRIGFRRSCCA